MADLEEADTSRHRATHVGRPRADRTPGLSGLRRQPARITALPEPEIDQLRRNCRPTRPRRTCSATPVRCCRRSRASSASSACRGTKFPFRCVFVPLDASRVLVILLVFTDGQVQEPRDRDAAPRRGELELVANYQNYAGQRLVEIPRAPAADARRTPETHFARHRRVAEQAFQTARQTVSPFSGQTNLMGRQDGAASTTCASCSAKHSSASATCCSSWNAARMPKACACSSASPASRRAGFPGASSLRHYGVDGHVLGVLGVLSRRA